MVEATYNVHSANEGEVAVMVDIGGQQVEAKVNGFVVELAAQDGTTCHTHRFTPPADEMDTYRELFTVGNNVTITFSAA